MDARQERGFQIAAAAELTKTDKGYLVPSQTGKGLYLVNGTACTCPDYAERKQPCKHVYAVEYVIQREENPDGSVTYTKRVSYTQQWTAYNAAQTHEGEHFERLLRALCDGIQQPPQDGRGRRRHLLSDVVFSLAVRTYSMKSGRRFMSGLMEAKADGCVARAVSYNSGFDYLENPALTSTLKALIADTAEPLKAIETDFAADSTGFGTTTYDRWYDAKWGKPKSAARFIKTHIMTGTKTNTITAVEATITPSSDVRQFPYLVAETAKRFTVKEVSADKGYSSHSSYRAVDAVGAAAYIHFQKRATGLPDTRWGFDPLWNKMHAYYHFQQADFMAHYHKRSNVESTFSMVKAKFGGSVRAKTPAAQINEVLLKILCHNIVVLVASMYELGIEPIFRAERALPDKRWPKGHCRARLVDAGCEGCILYYS